MRGQYFNIVGGMAIWERGIERYRGCSGLSRNCAFSDPVYIGLTNLRTWLVQKTMRAKIERIDRS